jgi:hypothetical protein
MTVVASSISGGKVTIAGSTVPKIYNISLPLANTEYSQALSSDVLKITIRLRGAANLRIAFNSGETSTNYFTIPSGCSFSESDLRLASSTLYFRADQASQTLEIIEWT